MSQLDLFTFTSDDTPALPLARVHGVNPATYHRDDCHWITTEPMPGYVLSLGFARDTDGWRMAAGYHFPDVGSIGPVFVRSNVYASYQEARRAGLERLRLMVNGLQLSFSISPGKAERLRKAIQDLNKADQSISPVQKKPCRLGRVSALGSCSQEQSCFTRVGV